MLKELYREFVQTGKIQCNSVNTDRFSRKIQTQKLAELVKKVSS